MYELTAAMNKAHLMRKLMAAWRDATSAVERISTFNDLLNQLQEARLQVFDTEVEAIFLLMTLPETWENHLVLFANYAKQSLVKKFMRK